LIISPADFDFPSPAKSNTFKIGPLVDLQREGEIYKPRYAVLLKEIQITKSSKKGKVIYCSLGTITGTFMKQVGNFFQKMKKVASLNPNDLFILSVGKNFDINKLFPSPENLFIFQIVPQIDLLKYCDIMITHGGMNSQTECILHGIPTLIYPLSYDWDQPGNAARAEYYKVGLKGNLQNDSAKKISKKLNVIKSKFDWYRENVSSMREKFVIKDQSDQVLVIIKNIIESPPKI
jgi:UDP:flavonoid glycosyltransferase YjiC (YdhE family)